jgi:hypothetical protein
MSINAYIQASLPVYKERGYYKLATLIRTKIECVIFKQFSKLNILNLMLMQVKLIDLEDNFNKIYKANASLENVNRKLFFISFTALRKYD